MGEVMWRLLSYAILASSLILATSGPAFAQGDPTDAAELCLSQRPADFGEFVDCFNDYMMTDRQHAIVECYYAMRTGGGYASCIHGLDLSRDEAIVANCAAAHGYNRGAFFSCIGSAYLPPEFSRIANCAAQHRTDVWSGAACMAGAYMTPEQLVIATCALQTGMTPLPLAACVGGRLTVMELDKCFSVGIGGRGCFGDNNEITKLVRGAWKGISGGPNSMLNNPGQIWGGPNSMFNNPAQVWGGPNSVFNRPSQIFGGPNSVFNNPGQLFKW